MANCGVAPFIGNVERENGVGLTDALRSLQIVNGAFGAKDMRDDDLNALDVTALGPNNPIPTVGPLVSPDSTTFENTDGEDGASAPQILVPDPANLSNPSWSLYIREGMYLGNIPESKRLFVIASRILYCQIDGIFTFQLFSLNSSGST